MGIIKLGVRLRLTVQRCGVTKNQSCRVNAALKESWAGFSSSLFKVF